MESADRVTLVPITERNIWRVVKLSVPEEQKDFVATNTESLLEAYLALANEDVALPFAICAGETPVGFLMFGYGKTGDPDEPDVAEGNYCLWRFMIDGAYQRRGYGRAALYEALNYLATFPRGNATSCWLSYEPENARAKALYASFGFVENGQVCGDEIVAVRPLP